MTCPECDYKFKRPEGYMYDGEVYVNVDGVVLSCPICDNVDIHE